MSNTPEEKAKELIEKYIQAAWDSGNHIGYPLVLSCAAICVQEKIDLLNSMPRQDATRAWRKEMQDELQSVLTSIQKQP